MQRESEFNMRQSEPHLCDEDLLLYLDRELPAARGAKARDHLSECEACRGRIAQFEEVLREVGSLHEQAVSRSCVLSLQSSSLLKARMRASAGPDPGRARWSSFRGSIPGQVASAGLALAIVAAGVWSIHSALVKRTGDDAVETEAAVALPRRTLTPGATHAVAFDDLCHHRELENDPPVSPSMQQAVFQEYGLSESSRDGYEVDYLITPALGGDGKIQNLWPQPSSVVWNAGVKDQLEDHLHGLVCDGKVQLTTAQNEIASDWIAAYKKYFDTDQPLQGKKAMTASLAQRSGSEANEISRRSYRNSAVLTLVPGCVFR